METFREIYKLLEIIFYFIIKLYKNQKRFYISIALIIYYL